MMRRTRNVARAVIGLLIAQLASAQIPVVLSTSGKGYAQTLNLSCARLKWVNL